MLHLAFISGQTGGKQNVNGDSFIFCFPLSLCCCLVAIEPWHQFNFNMYQLIIYKCCTHSVTHVFNLTEVQGTLNVALAVCLVQRCWLANLSE